HASSTPSTTRSTLYSHMDIREENIWRYAPDVNRDSRRTPSVVRDAPVHGGLSRGGRGRSAAARRLLVCRRVRVTVEGDPARPAGSPSLTKRYLALSEPLSERPVLHVIVGSIRPGRVGLP